MSLPRGSLGLGICLEGLRQLLMLVICTKKHIVGKNGLVTGIQADGNASGSVHIYHKSEQ